jgi:hypothetical protein
VEGAGPSNAADGAGPDLGHATATVWCKVSAIRLRSRPPKCTPFGPRPRTADGLTTTPLRRSLCEEAVLCPLVGVKVIATGFGNAVADEGGRRRHVQLDQSETSELLRFTTFRLTSRILLYLS